MSAKIPYYEAQRFSLGFPRDRSTERYRTLCVLAGFHEGWLHKQLNQTVRNPVFLCTRRSLLKPDFSATETSYAIENLNAASVVIILSRRRIMKALTCLRECAGRSARSMFAQTKGRFPMK